MAQPKETSLAERVSYAAYFAGQNATYFLIQTYLVTFYVSGLNIEPAIVGTLILGVRIWDAFNDPLIGVFMDRMRFAGSRYKGWTSLMAFLMPLATFLIFLAPQGAAMPAKVAYVVLTYLFWDIVFTMSEVPMFSLSTMMTKNSTERTTLLTLTQVGSVLGVAVSTVVLTFLLGEGVEGINWLLFGGIPSGLAVLMMIPQTFTVEERHNTEAVEDVPLKEMIKNVLQNDQHLIIMALYLSQMFNNAVNGFAVYVAQGYYGDARFAQLAGVFILVGVLGLGTITPRIVKRFGKRTYVQAAMVATIVFSIPLFFIPGRLAWLAMVFIGIRTATLVVTTLLRPMFTADCIEYGEAKNGTRNDASAFAIQTLFNKTGDAIGQSLTAFILALVMFNESLPVGQQPPGTIDRLQFFFVLLPMLMAAVFFFGVRYLYKLDESRVKEYIRKNDEAEDARGRMLEEMA